MRTGILVVSRDSEVLGTYSVTAEQELIATIGGLAFHFQPPQYPLPPRVPDERDIDKMGLLKILDYLMARYADVDNDDEYLDE